MKDVPEDLTRTFLSVFVIDAKSNLLDCKMLLKELSLIQWFFLKYRRFKNGNSVLRCF